MIYTPEGSTTKYDPLALDRLLRVATGNKLAKLVEQWKSADSDEGDISEEGMLEKLAASCEAEERLAHAARVAFNMPDFPECTDGQALELLCDYLDWLKKKGQRGSTLPGYSTSGEPSPHVPTMNS